MSPLPAPPRYMIGSAPAPLDPALQAALEERETTALGHILYWGSLAPEIQPVWPGVPRLAGRALTVEIPASCSAMLHHAIGLAEPGDVLVIDRRGDRTYACLGGGVARAAQARGIAGAVIDGPCTDLAELAELRFPVWCRGASATTTRLANLGGRVHVPVSCGGVAVMPGDAVLADENGVFALSPALAGMVVETSQARSAALRARSQAIAPGLSLGERSGATALVESDLWSL